MVIRNSYKAIKDGDDLLRDLMRNSDNSKDVLSVLKEQNKIKLDLKDDAMDEILPYLEDGP
jgi:hypothetical protein